MPDRAHPQPAPDAPRQIVIGRLAIRTDRPFILYAIAFCTLTALALVGVLQSYARPAQQPFVLALSLHWLLMAGISALVSNLLYHVAPARFHPARWERDGAIYESLGVKQVQWLLLHTPLGWLNPSLQLRTGRRDLQRLLRELNPAEGTHLLAGAGALLLAGGYAWWGYARVSLWLCLLDLPLNLYPIALQRYNRGRVTRLLRRQMAA